MKKLPACHLKHFGCCFLGKGKGKGDLREGRLGSGWEEVDGDRMMVIGKRVRRGEIWDIPELRQCFGCTWLWWRQ
jgi:hypothetical protein